MGSEVVNRACLKSSSLFVRGFESHLMQKNIKYNEKQFKHFSFTCVCPIL